MLISSISNLILAGTSRASS